VTLPIYRRGYDGADVASPSALTLRHGLGGTGVDTRSARADSPGLLDAAHVAAADPHPGYVLKSLMPAVRVNRSATFNLVNNTITDLTWNTEMYDSHAMHDTSTNNHRLVCVLAGLHHVELNLEFQANATGFRGIHIVHSADGVVAKHYLPQVGVAVSPILHVSCDHDMSVGEYVYAQAWQTSGGNLLVGNQLWDTFSALWMRISP
jgi:hypothetical protein